MRGTAIIYRRELGSLFAAPLAWVLLFLSLLLNWMPFTILVGQQTELMGTVDITASLEFVFGSSPLFWLLILMLAPLIAMRLLAEESANGTLEYLRTAPVSDTAVVLGKFLAGLTFMAVLWGSIFLYAGGIQLWGGPPDWGQIIAIYCGAVLASGIFIALSLVPSAMTRTPLLAAFLAFIGCTVWLLIPWAGAQLLIAMRVLLADSFGGYDQAERFVMALFDRMSVSQHFARSYFRGILDSAEVIFFLTWIGFFLFLTARTLETRRWRG